MGAIDQTQAGKLLNAMLRQTSVASTGGINVRLGTTAPTATTNMTELTGTGYTTGGQAAAFSAASAGSSSNSASLTWTNSSGSSWSITGVELWDQATTALRWMYGTWIGAPVTVANGNSFVVAAGALIASLA